MFLFVLPFLVPLMLFDFSISVYVYFDYLMWTQEDSVEDPNKE